MPTLEWNKRWGQQANTFRAGDKYFNQHQIYGYQWGDPTKTTASFVLPEFVVPLVRPSSVVLEIGPGGGRYTQFLKNCASLYLVEYNPEFFPILESLLRDAPCTRHYIQSPGSSFPSVPNNSVDFVFSFDCFVHLDISLIRGYLTDISRVLKKDGTAVIHYADKRKPLAQQQGANFSDTTPEIMSRLLVEHGYRIKAHDTERISHSAIVAFAHADDAP